MTRLFVLFFLSWSTSYAQSGSTFANIQNTSTALAKLQFNECVKNSKNCTLPADVLANVEATPLAPHFSQCATPGASQPANQSPTSGSETTQEILLITELSDDKTRIAAQNPYILDKAFFLKYPLPEGSTSNPKLWTLNQISRVVSDPDLKDQLTNNPKGLKDLMQSMYVEAILHSLANTPQENDGATAKKIADYIRQYSENDVDRVAILGTLSSRLSQTTTASTSLNQTVREVVAMVAEKVFPKRDVLVAKNKTHSGVVLNDKANGQIIIDWVADLNVSNQPQSSSSSETPANATIATVSQMKDGKLHALATLDSETGVVFKKLFTSNIPTLQLSIDPSIIYLNIKKENGTENKGLDLRGRLAVAKTSKSKMIVLVGEKTRSTQTNQLNTGYAVALQRVDATGNQNLIVAIHDGFKQDLIHYVSPTVTLKASSSVELDAQYTKQILKTDAQDLEPILNPALSGNLQFTQGVQFETHPKKKQNPSFKVDAQVVHGIGSSDWLNRQSDLTAPGARSVLKTMNQTNLHLNQIYVNGTMKIPMKAGMTSKTNVTYQGTNVGQKIDVSTGIEVQNSGGMKIYAFVGYVDAGLKGYRTDGSILAGTSGAKTGFTVQTKGGTKLSGTLQGIGGPAMNANVTAAIPVFRRSKK